MVHPANQNKDQKEVMMTAKTSNLSNLLGAYLTERAEQEEGFRYATTSWASASIMTPAAGSPGITLGTAPSRMTPVGYAAGARRVPEEIPQTPPFNPFS